MGVTKMICENLVFQGLPTTLYDLANEGRYEELYEVLKNLRVCSSSSYEHSTEHEVRRFVRALISQKKHSLIKEYMPMIVKALVEAEDYNALLMINDHPKLYGVLSPEGAAIVKKYGDAAERTKKAFKDNLPVNEDAIYSSPIGKMPEPDLDISFEHRLLTFRFEGGRKYRVLRFE